MVGAHYPNLCTEDKILHVFKFYLILPMIRRYRVQAFVRMVCNMFSTEGAKQLKLLLRVLAGGHNNNQ